LLPKKGGINTESLLDFYTTVWNTAFAGDEQSLTAVLTRAGEIVGNSLSKSESEIGELPYFLANDVKKAICTQADYMNSNGGLAGFADTPVGANVKIGNFSISEESTTPLPAYELCEAARGYLYKTGLLFAGVNVC
jgi:hypothetical protein